jgi:hypothetical protein
MPGGIIEMASYGSQEMYLTSSPQITFFKIVFRRHTNFAVETIRQHFVNPVNFGSESTVIIDKLGDLMGKIYLEFTLPEVAIPAIHDGRRPSEKVVPTTYDDGQRPSERIVSTIRDDPSIATQTQTQKIFELVQNFTKINTSIAREIGSLITISNITLDSITDYVKSSVNALNAAADAVSNVTDSTDVYSVSIVNLYNNLFIGIEQRDAFDIDIDQYLRYKIRQLIFKDFYPKMKYFYDSFYKLFVLPEPTLFELTAWAEEPGHAILEEVQFSIGNKKIDTQNGQWLSIHRQLTQTLRHNEAYDILIGQVPELITFDGKPKPSYTLTVPLQFYFCKYSGLAVPLISLKNSDISIDFRFRTLQQLLKTQYDLDLDLKPENASIFVEYYFLANDERERFATRVQEYLIETVNWRSIPNLITQGSSQSISFDFNHPTKYITWFGQPQFYREDNFLAYFKYDYQNQSVISYTKMYFNNIVRLDTHVKSSFYNYVQPYYYAKRTPSKGLQLYSFALYPFDYNPSGTVNLSRIDTIRMELEFNPEAVEASMVGGLGMYVGVYAVSYNVLRIANGVASLAFE